MKLKPATAYFTIFLVVLFLAFTAGCGGKIAINDETIERVVKISCVDGGERTHNVNWDRYTVFGYRRLGSVTLEKVVLPNLCENVRENVQVDVSASGKPWVRYRVKTGDWFDASSVNSTMVCIVQLDIHIQNQNQIEFLDRPKTNDDGSIP